MVSAKPQISILTRVASAVFALLSIILVLNVLRFRGTQYYFGIQEIPQSFINGRDQIVGWQFAFVISVLSIGFLASLLLLCAQFACATQWALERGFLAAFHLLMFASYTMAGVVLIVWLASPESPAKFDYTQAGPSASGLMIASCITSFLAAALAFYGLCIIKVYRLENSKQGFVYAPSTAERVQLDRITSASTEQLYIDRQSPKIIPIYAPPPKREPKKVEFYSSSSERHSSRPRRSRRPKGRSNKDYGYRGSSKRSRPYSTRSNIEEVRLPTIGERHYCRSLY